MKIYLLTHPREVNKKTNTGTLVSEVLAEKCQLFLWHRVTPSPELLANIERESVALLYPTEDSETIEDVEQFDSIIILDGTWQEAQKMYNRSAYLKTLKKIKITPRQASIFTLRRNQKSDGLCTAECAIEILKLDHCDAQAEQLQTKLNDFIESC